MHFINLRSVTVILLTWLFVGLTAAGLAAAAPYEATGYRHVFTGSGSTWLGSYFFPADNKRYFCAAQNGPAGPERHLDESEYLPLRWLDGSKGDSHAGFWDRAKAGNPSQLYFGPHVMSARQGGPNLDQPNSSTVTQSGRVLQGDNLNRIGYVLSKFGQTLDHTVAAQVRMLVLEKFQVLYFSVWDQHLKNPSNSTALRNRETIDAMWNEAINWAGPYRVNTEVALAHGGRSGELASPQLLSAQGIPVPDIAWRAEIVSENAIFGNGSTMVTGRTGQGEAGLAWHGKSHASGTVDIAVTFIDVPGYRVGLRQSTRADGQDVFTGEDLHPQFLVQSETPLTEPAEYKISTSTSAAQVSPGSAVSDQLQVEIVSGEWPLGEAVLVTSQLFGPLSDKPIFEQMPPNPPLLETVVTEITGPGNYQTPEILVSAPGYYVWMESAPATVGLDHWEGAWGVPTEITLVPWLPQIETRANVNVSEAEIQVDDRIWISAAPPQSELQVTVELFHFPQQVAPELSAEVPESAELVFTTELNVVTDQDGNAEFTVATELADEAPGWYSWRISIAAGEKNSAVTTPIGIPSETVIVPWRPEITTQAVSATRTDRDQGLVVIEVWDEVTIAGLPEANLNGFTDETVSVDLFFIPLESGVDPSHFNAGPEMCVAENLLTTMTLPAKNGVFSLREAAYSAPVIGSERDGWYLFVHRFAGNETVSADYGVCGEAVETLLLLPSAEIPELPRTGAVGTNWLPAVLVAVGAGSLMIYYGRKLR